MKDSMDCWHSIFSVRLEKDMSFGTDKLIQYIQKIKNPVLTQIIGNVLSINHDQYIIYMVSVFTLDIHKIKDFSKNFNEKEFQLPSKLTNI